MNNCLIVCAKEPIPGKVKTRLRSFLSDGDCALLSQALIRDVLTIARAVTDVERILAYDGCGHEPRFLRSVADDFVFLEQRGEDLGMRMQHAFSYAAGQGAERIVVIGSDVPTLPVLYIEQAFKRLTDNDVVLGPSVDGGYYLIGMRRPILDVFSGVAWSSHSVLERTIINIRAHGYRSWLLDEWYDIDTKESLQYFINDVRHSTERFGRHSRQCLNQILFHLPNVEHKLVTEITQRKSYDTI